MLVYAPILLCEWNSLNADCKVILHFSFAKFRITNVQYMRIVSVLYTGNGIPITNRVNSD